MRKSQTVFEPVSTPLEDEIDVPYTLVGSQQWFDSAFEPGAVLDSERVVISNRAQLEPIIAQARSLSLIGVDTETTGPYQTGNKGFTLNPVNKGTRIVLLQIGNEEHVWIIDPAFIEYFRDVLENTDQLHLAHNWSFDFKWLLVKNKIHPCNLYCSMLAEQLLTAGLVGLRVGLADCARRYKPYYIISKAVRSLFIQLNDGKMTREMVKYAARDIPLLFSVYRGQITEIVRHNMEYVSELEFENIPVAAEMESGGFYLDQVKLRLLIKFWEDKKRAMEDAILDAYNTRSAEVGRLMAIVPEWRDVFKLESNADKKLALKKIEVDLTDAKRATLIASGDPIALMLADYSNITKMTSTYGENMLEKINEDTKMFYPRFAQMGSGSSTGESDGRDTKETTATGRWVGDAQQYPRKSDGKYAKPDEDERVDVLAAFEEEITKAKAKYTQEEKAA